MSQAQLKKLLKEYDGDLDRLVSDLKAAAHDVKKSKQPKREYGDTLVKISGLKKTFKQGKTPVEALKQADLNIRQGEFVSLVGPSGSGKSTLLNAIAGLDKPTDGSITVDGQDLRDMSQAELSSYRSKSLGFVFQFFYLQPFLTLRENVEVPLMFSRVKKTERQEKSAKVLAAVGLSDRADFLPKQLSGGQMQRAAIARALINEPKIILADEPTGNLDKKNGETIMEIFENVRDEFKTSLLVVTHDESVAGRADRIVKMDDGVLHAGE